MHEDGYLHIIKIYMSFSYSIPFDISLFFFFGSIKQLQTSTYYTYVHIVAISYIFIFFFIYFKDQWFPSSSLASSVPKRIFNEMKRTLKIEMFNEQLIYPFIDEVTCFCSHFGDVSLYFRSYLLQNTAN